MENLSISNQERRISKRRSIRVPCQIICDGVQVKATLVDISEEGVGFVTAMPLLHTWRKIELLVDNAHIPNQEHLLRLRIEIKNQSHDSFAARFGAHLKEIPQEYLRFFQRLFSSKRQSHFRQAFSHFAAAEI
ncbi:hypothetical protein THMIRHAS_09780 [Thiosulfatimonas sediminis]|uniref:PilZ domain-containing protein n=1 Tax=Thiosulfatimonas sediminis TaxID=2675054 RepID=A0A6F8PU07_9GAMM|nr:PilZ domain-containing protein [Thiosulfatimonas sediminis]BBP45605.1 hypothetical protein THMIRHAS_09780 [Thiosulfatimonas sediminis]